MTSLTAICRPWAFLASLLVIVSITFDPASGVTCRTGSGGAYYAQSNCTYCQKIVYSVSGVGGPFASCAQVCSEGTSPVGGGISVSTYCCQSDLCNGAVNLFGQLSLVILLPSLAVLPLIAAAVTSCSRQLGIYVDLQ